MPSSRAGSTRALAALHRSGDVDPEIHEVDLDAPRADEVLVRVMACGVCHTDLFLRGRWPADRWPMVFGHESAGIVERAGTGVGCVEEGDHVVLSYRSCGRCGPCQRGHAGHCAAFRALNMSGTRPDGSTTMTLADGHAAVFGSCFGQSGFATHALAHETNVVRIDEDVDLAVAAPLGCGFQTGAGTVLNVLRPGSDASLVVLGAGGVGIAAVMAAAAFGVRAFVVEPIAERRALAAQLGATTCIDPERDDPVDAILDLTDGGADFALDTTANSRAIRTGLHALAPLGVLALVGAGASDVALDANHMVVTGKRIVGVVEGDARPRTFIPDLLNLYKRGRFPIDAAITRYPFAEIGRALTDSRDGRTVKPILTMDGYARVDQGTR